MDFDFQTLFIVYVIVLNSLAFSISDVFKQDDESGPVVLIFYTNLILVVIPIIIIYFFF